MMSSALINAARTHTAPDASSAKSIEGSLIIALGEGSKPGYAHAVRGLAVHFRD